MGVERLTERHEAATDALLGADPLQNLFLISFLDPSSLGKGLWYGMIDGDSVRAVAMVIPDRLCVPYAPDPHAAAAIGRKLRVEHAPSMMVGPRLACDALWDAWARHRIQPERFYDQRLYVCRAPPVGEPMPGFRRAVATEWEPIAENAAQMEIEDVGRNPLGDPEAHEASVRERIQNGKTWVIERDGRIVFQINVGTATPLGCQVGGTWVPQDLRGTGLATAGMRELCRRLLTRHPFVSLHVNEANGPAVSVYEKSGFVRAAPYRLITVRG